MTEEALECEKDFNPLNMFVRLIHVKDVFTCIPYITNTHTRGKCNIIQFFSNKETNMLKEKPFAVTSEGISFHFKPGINSVVLRSIYFGN